MSTGSEFPSMGAALFFGLTATTLITQGAPEIEFANPNETMAETGFKAQPTPAPFVLYAAWGEPVTFRDADLVTARPAALPFVEARDIDPQKPPRDLPSPDLTDTVADMIAARPRRLGDPGAIDARSPERKSPLRLASGLSVPVALPQPDAPIAYHTQDAPDAPPAVALAGGPLAAPIARLDPFNAPHAGYAGDALTRSAVPYPRLAVIDHAFTSPASPAPFALPQVAVSAVAPITAQNQPAIRQRDAKSSRVRMSGGLAEAPPSHTLPDAQRTPRLARVTGDYVFLRVAPSAGARSIGQFDAGARALIYEERGPWRRVEISGTVGWMFGRYLNPNTLE